MNTTHHFVCVLGSVICICVHVMDANIGHHPVTHVQLPLINEWNSAWYIGNMRDTVLNERLNENSIWTFVCSIQFHFVCFRRAQVGCGTLQETDNEIVGFQEDATNELRSSTEELYFMEEKKSEPSLPQVAIHCLINIGSFVNWIYCLHSDFLLPFEAMHINEEYSLTYNWQCHAISSSNVWHNCELFALAIAWLMTEYDMKKKQKR